MDGRQGLLGLNDERTRYGETPRELWRECLWTRREGVLEPAEQSNLSRLGRGPIQWAKRLRNRWGWGREM